MSTDQGSLKVLSSPGSGNGVGAQGMVAQDRMEATRLSCSALCKDSSGMEMVLVEKGSWNLL